MQINITKGCIFSESHTSVFEGDTGGGHLLDFVHYKGECQPRHNWDTLHEAVLLNPSNVAANDIKDGNNEQIKSQFLEFMDQVNKRKDYPQIKLEVRFGKIYYYKLPCVTNVNELLNLEMGGVGSPPRSAFQPLHMSHEASETYLEQEGYQLTSTETSFSIYLKQEVNRVVLNEQLKVAEISSEYRKPLILNIKRVDLNRRDYRFILSEENILKSDDPVTEDYKRREIMKKESEDDIIVTEEFISKVQMIRQKITKKFSKDAEKGEVQLVKVKEHFEPSKEGRFTEVKPWREELVVIYKVPESWRDSVYTSFIQDVMKLSYRFEDVIYQARQKSNSGADEA